MCGLIVVEAGRSRSTNLGRYSYIMIIAWISSWLFEVGTGLTRCRPIFHDWSGIPRRTWRTRGRTERNHKGKHSRTSPITHPLDNQTHKIHKVHEQQRERYKVEFIPNPMKEMRAWILEGSSHEGGLESRGIFSHGGLELHGSGSLSLSLSL